MRAGERKGIAGRAEGVNKRADITHHGGSSGHGCAPLIGSCGPAVARIELRK
jgi:hypothetical protein